MPSTASSSHHQKNLENNLIQYNSSKMQSFFNPPLNQRGPSTAVANQSNTSHNLEESLIDKSFANHFFSSQITPEAIETYDSRGPLLQFKNVIDENLIPQKSLQHKRKPSFKIVQQDITQQVVQSSHQPKLTNFQQYQPQTKKLKKKIMTEPNSPTQSYSELVQGALQSQKGQGKQILAGKDLPIKMSMNKLNLIKPTLNAHVPKLKSKRPPQPDNANFTSKLNQTCIQEGNDDYTPVSDNAKHSSSFLPKLDRGSRYSNSQVLYKDLTISKRDIKERVDMSCKNSSSNWTSDLIQKKSQSQERTGTGSKPSMNAQIQEFHKVFTPYKGRKGSREGSSRYINVQPQHKDLNFAIKAQTSSHRQNHNEFSPSQLIRGGFQDYQQVKNIGKVQPIQEMKQINEHIIRSKLNRAMNQNMHIKIAMSEAVSPVSNNSPLFKQSQQDRFKPIKSILQSCEGTDQSLQHIQQEKNQYELNLIKSLNQRSGSEHYPEFVLDNLVAQTEAIQSQNQFHIRNYSVSSDATNSQAQALQKHQFNTIEEILKSNKEQFNLATQQALKQRKSSNEAVLRHPIKTLASKQMPKCFRMNKHQIQNLHKYYKKEAEHPQSDTPNSSFIQQTHDTSYQQMNATLSGSTHQHGGNIFRTPYASRDRHLDIQDEEKERMTPAFNQRSHRLRESQNNH